jgi:GTP-binding protein
VSEAFCILTSHASRVTHHELRLSVNVTDAAFVKSVAEWEALPSDDVPEAVLVGRSNVGKSTLLNRLVGQGDLADPSGKPERTRGLDVYRVERADGGPLHLLDAPGLGYAKAPEDERERWKRFIVRYLTERAPLRLVLHGIDSRREFQPLDRELLQLLGGQRVPYLAVLTKADTLGERKEHARAVRRAKETLLEAGLEAPVVLTSAENGDGVSEVRAWIGDLVR